MPFRIEIKTDSAKSLEQWSAQKVANEGRPRVKLGEYKNRPLAVVGGAPTVALDLDELKAWKGDIWAVNYTADWLHSHGIECFLFTVDPGNGDDDGPVNSPVRKRILASSCPPSLFTDESLAFDMVECSSIGVPGGTTSATRAPCLALAMGYTDVHFFGCDGSFEDVDHVDRHENTGRQMIIRAGGHDYITRPEFLVQCEEFVKIFRDFSAVFKNRSRGLLKAMCENPDTWEVVGVSAEMKAHLEEVNGKQGFYDAPYVSINSAALPA